MNEHDLEQMRKSSPTQRFKNLTEVIITIYKEELQKPFDLRINFD